MQTLTAQNSQDLESKLREIGISVPPRTEGRTSEHTERWSICRWLSTMNAGGALSFPIKLEDRESPDFKLTTSREIIGIEITEAIPEDYAKASAMAERQGGAYLDLSEFRWGNNKTIQEILDHISAGVLNGRGWCGDEAEHEFASAMAAVTAKKTEKLAGSYERFGQDFLLIYNNLPLPFLDYNNAITYLGNTFDPYWNSTGRFSAIYIESGKRIICMTDRGINFVPLSDVWRQQ